MPWWWCPTMPTFWTIFAPMAEDGCVQVSRNTPKKFLSARFGSRNCSKDVPKHPQRFVFFPRQPTGGVKKRKDPSTKAEDWGRKKHMENVIGPRKSSIIQSAKSLRDAEDFAGWIGGFLGAMGLWIEKRMLMDVLCSSPSTASPSFSSPEQTLQSCRCSFTILCPLHSLNQLRTKNC